MSSRLHIEQMSSEEKLRLMEALLDDLRTKPAEVPVPQWHQDVLDERERLVQAGDAHFIDWETAKNRITEEANYSDRRLKDADGSSHMD